MAASTLKFATNDASLLLYAEMDEAAIRSAQRQLKAGQLARIVPGMVSASTPDQWPALVARERLRVLAALFPQSVLAFRSAFHGGVPEDGEIHLSGSYRRDVVLPGLKVHVWKGPPPAPGDLPMQGRPLYFPSLARIVLENLSPSRGDPPKAVGQAAVEQRLLSLSDARGESALSQLREQARALAPHLSLLDAFDTLDAMVGSILGTRASRLVTPAGKARTAAVPYDADRLALFEQFAAQLRRTPLQQASATALTETARTHLAFLESYFSNFIEGTEFEVQDARGFVLQGQPILQRPQDSHDILGVFHQARDLGWANQTLGTGEAALTQLRARHGHLMRERPEVSPGEFKDKANRAGNTEFVAPAMVRGTLLQASQLLPTVAEGMARALLAMFVVTEVHPFADGNGRLARLVMNAELSVVNASRIIVPTLFREEYLDCLRLLTRDGQAEPFMAAMQKIQQWTAAFHYQDLDEAIDQMTDCNAFERSRSQFKLLAPGSQPPTGA
jgi:hypothetical protein